MRIKKDVSLIIKQHNEEYAEHQINDVIQHKVYKEIKKELTYVNDIIQETIQQNSFKTTTCISYSSEDRIYKWVPISFHSYNDFSCSGDVERFESKEELLSSCMSEVHSGNDNGTYAMLVSGRVRHFYTVLEEASKAVVDYLHYLQELSLFESTTMRISWEKSKKHPKQCLM